MPSSRCPPGACASSTRPARRWAAVARKVPLHLSRKVPVHLPTAPRSRTRWTGGNSRRGSWTSTRRSSPRVPTARAPVTAPYCDFPCAPKIRLRTSRRSHRWRSRETAGWNRRGTSSPVSPPTRIKCSCSRRHSRTLKPCAATSRGRRRCSAGSKTTEALSSWWMSTWRRRRR